VVTDKWTIGQKRGVPCGGYKKDFKWRPFEEASLGKAPKPARKSTVSPTIAC